MWFPIETLLCTTPLSLVSSTCNFFLFYYVRLTPVGRDKMPVAAGPAGRRLPVLAVGTLYMNASRELVDSERVLRVQRTVPSTPGGRLPHI